jgi:hypothetical protein
MNDSEWKDKDPGHEVREGEREDKVIGNLFPQDSHLQDADNYDGIWNRDEDTRYE